MWKRWVVSGKTVRKATAEHRQKQRKKGEGKRMSFFDERVAVGPEEEEKGTIALTMFEDESLLLALTSDESASET